jgi:hypothetical protein
MHQHHNLAEYVILGAMIIAAIYVMVTIVRKSPSDL